MKKKQRTTLQRLCFLAKQLEDSKHYALNAIQPGFISNETKFVTFGTNRFTRREEDVINDEALNKVIEELDRLAAYLHCTSIQAAMFTAAFSKSLYRLSVDFDDIRWILLCHIKSHPFCWKYHGAPAPQCQPA